MEVEGDTLMHGDHRTVLVIRDIANQVCQYTSLARVEVDYPSAHHSGFMPILDIQVRVREDKTRQWTGNFTKSQFQTMFLYSTEVLCQTR